jgi:hypothetical protein
MVVICCKEGQNTALVPWEGLLAYAHLVAQCNVTSHEYSSVKSNFSLEFFGFSPTNDREFSSF